MNKKVYRFCFRLSETEREIFERNFKNSGLKSRNKFIVKLIQDIEVPVKLKSVNLKYMKDINSRFAKNTNLIKYNMTSDDPISKKRIDMIINENEKIKKEIQKLLDSIKNDLNI